MAADFGQQKVDKRTRSKWSRRCGTRWNTSRMLNRLPHSYGERVESTSVLGDLPDVSDEVVGTSVQNVDGLRHTLRNRDSHIPG